MDTTYDAPGRLDLGEGTGMVAALGLRDGASAAVPVCSHGEGATRPAGLVEFRDRVLSRVVEIYRGHEIREIDEPALYRFRIRRLGQGGEIRGAYFASVTEAQDAIDIRVNDLISRTQAIYGGPAA